MHRLLFVFGTRPEAIKLAPLILKCKQTRDFATKVCITAQHREMLDDVLHFFHIAPDYDLNLMRPDQSLFDVTSAGMNGLKKVLDEYKPENVFVQGDTTTAFIGALAGFYAKSKVSHVEAGLRSGDRSSPYPEEMNRVLVGRLADYHFAPTQVAARNLHSEGISERVWVVGNTVIDALHLSLRILSENGDENLREFFKFVDSSKKVILMTCHRREAFGEKLENIFSAIRELSDCFSDIQIVFPVHPNPRVTEPAFRILSGNRNIHLVRPLSYPQLVWIMSRSHFILTDSGDLQEEAPSLGKPVLVMRDVTERVEAIQAGTSRLIGTSKESILREVSTLLTDGRRFAEMSKAINPYGDGTACNQILEVVTDLLAGHAEKSAVDRKGRT